MTSSSAKATHDEPPEVARFLEYLLEERRFSAHTAAAYGSDLKQFGDFLKRIDFAQPLSSTGKPEIRLWLRELADSVGSNTLARKMATLRAFYRFMMQTGHGSTNPAAGMRLPKIRRKLPLTISAEAASELMDAPSGEVQETARDRAILELLYGCGLRVSELTSLNFDSIDLEARVIHVHGKGKKERVVPLGKPALLAVQSHLAASREKVTEDKVRSSRSSSRRQASPLFLGARGGRLGVRRVQELVQHYGSLATGRANLHPHALRHACATHMLEGGADLRAIQDMLGHETVATTQRYTHLSTQKLTQIYDLAHPLARVSTPRSSRSTPRPSRSTSKTK